MKLNREIYRDKLYACFLGKNIGGTMGTPYEGKRELLDIKGFSTPPNVVLPNDDLDLQLVWLRALEETGPWDLDARRLGEFWLSFVTPHWNEYGIGKSNMQRGLPPPLSGDFENRWRDSNGAWIRTELWAALAPGFPDIAARYAFEDASVDHGTGEGSVAAVFVAAMESAAFVESDFGRLIELGLSRIPEKSRLAQSVRLVLDCRRKGMTWQQAREAVLHANADIGDGWFEAPSNVSYTLIGLLWGEGDFKRSMIIAINCGDDTDCTGATLGSLMGIAHGSAVIPADWRAHIGDAIATVSIARGTLSRVPETCTELTERVLAQVPHVLRANRADFCFTDGESEIKEGYWERLMASGNASLALLSRPPMSYTEKFGYMSATVMYPATVRIQPGQTIEIRIRFENNGSVYGQIPYGLCLRWLLPEGFSVSGPQNVQLPHRNAHYDGTAEAVFAITAPDAVQPQNRPVLEVTAPGRLTAAYIPVILLG